MLAQLPFNFRDALLKLYNEAWTTGQIPKAWNHAIIIPILKPNKKKIDPSSYRPISLPPLCKIMEKLMTNRLT